MLTTTCSALHSAPLPRLAAPASTTTAPATTDRVTLDSPPPEPVPGIPLDTPWKQQVFAFAQNNLRHSAWGLAHAERDYLLGRDLAGREHLAVDDDVLFAAAFLHDMGGFAPFQERGVDHAVRSAELVGDTVLRPAGFPEEKIPAVQQAIIHHSYYDAERPTTPEGIVLHDADVLDFLGAVSAARILSVTERETAAPDLGGAVRLLDVLLRDAPPTLMLPASKEMGAHRAEELRSFITALDAETFDRKAL